MNVILFMTRQIAAAIFSLTLPIFLVITGFLIIMTYIMFSISTMMLIFSDHTSMSLQMVAMAVMMFLSLKVVIYILAWIKVKLSLVWFNDGFTTE